MIIKDRIYGKVIIDSPVLIKLLNSAPIMRLKNIAQFGVPDELYQKKNFSRYEHSVGVMLLLKILGASEKEQIAGLLHDVSHTAFSHVIDWVVGDGRTEDFQDRLHRKFIEKTTIPGILTQFGYDFREISDLNNFKLVDTKIPDLCADRIDYAFREFKKSEADFCLKNLIVYGDKLVFRIKKAAARFAKNFLNLQLTHWGRESPSRYHLFANMLKLAAKKKIIKFTDFYFDDNFVMRKIKAACDPEISEYIIFLRNKSLDKFPKSKKIVFKKFRYVDPLYISGNNLVRLTHTDANFTASVKKARIENEKGELLPLFKNA